MCIRRLADNCDIHQFLERLCANREVIALEHGEGGNYHLTRSDAWDRNRHVVGAYRSVEPLKSLLFQPREYFGSTSAPESSPSIPERIVVGVKNCDLAGLRIQDHVFLDMEPTDPRYLEAREKTILVSCDCSDCLDVCFCPVVHEKPYAEKGFDINLSPVGSTYLITTDTNRGSRLVEANRDLLTEAEEELVVERDRTRQALYERLVEQSADFGLSPETDLVQAVKGAANTRMWRDIAVDCVECGACSFTCCTCHCFLLADGSGAESVPVRGKQWDSCLLMNFARVAGNHNPRAGRALRLRNRFLKKFSYFPDVLDCYACDGCGRCTEVCTGNIDIRKVLKRAVDESESLHADHGDH